ncbi:hypothetical protein OG884_30630 [Streptosporangium sp. NBC_01755]|uniref:hypothetical protein n=1 Tax=unclassified Streptosporangium TaxID=2632669 RepID=UPI002DD84EC0|nr:MULTISPECIES: hypothetical protein [unclassified Streptosporangium]WSA29394.1 hypothetical protein OIE13_16845 [Streptosporangium sp. NBC_01810]WSC99162.1 hypothetical protein OG884_30630 [Streptosporangium sp. NBC_01755]
MNNRFNPDNDRLVHKADENDPNAPRHTEDVAPGFQEPHHGDASRGTPVPPGLPGLPGSAADDLRGDVLGEGTDSCST